MGSWERGSVTAAQRSQVAVRCPAFHTLLLVMPLCDVYPTPLVLLLCLPLEQETKLGQRFVVDATLHCDLQRAGATDELEHTVNYAQVHHDIKEVVEGQPVKLIEHLAHRVCAAVLARHPAVDALRVHVHKPHVAIPGQLTSVSVEVFRRRGDAL